MQSPGFPGYRRSYFDRSMPSPMAIARAILDGFDNHYRRFGMSHSRRRRYSRMAIGTRYASVLVNASTSTTARYRSGNNH